MENYDENIGFLEKTHMEQYKENLFAEYEQKTEFNLDTQKFAKELHNYRMAHDNGGNTSGEK